MNTTQQLKLLGLMRDTTLEDARDAPIPQSMHDEAAMLNAPYCGNPLHRDDEIAASDPDTVNQCLDLEDRDLAEHIIELHKQAPAEDAANPPDGAHGLGRGSWPAGCPHVSQWYGPGDHAMTYFVERSTFSDNWKRPVKDSEYQFILDLEVYDESHGGPWGPLRTIEDCKRAFVYRTEEAARDADKAVGDPLDVLDICFTLMEEIYRRVGCACVRVYTGPDGEHNMHARGKVMPGSLAGYAYFNDGKCTGHVNLFLDNLLGQEFQFAVNLTSHEVGHNHNLQHQFGNQGGSSGHHELMSYSSNKWTAQGYSTGKPPFRLPRAPSLTPLQRFFDWQSHIPPPLTKPDAPPPEDPGVTGTLIGEVLPNGKVAIRGSIRLEGEFAGQEFIFVPESEEGGRYKPFPKP